MEDEYRGQFDTALDELKQAYVELIKAIFDTPVDTPEGKVLGRFFDYTIGKLGRWSNGL